MMIFEVRQMNGRKLLFYLMNIDLALDVMPGLFVHAKQMRRSMTKFFTQPLAIQSLNALGLYWTER